MRQWPVRQRRVARIEIIPMIDVMMFLLVFFVLISINVLPALGLKIKPPSSAAPDQVAERQHVMVGIDSDGKTFLDGQPIDVADLSDRLKAMEDPNKKTAVVVAGDEKTPLQTLVGILDALKKAGVASAQIVARTK
jgi:biopolymer transport protein ExbD